MMLYRVPIQVNSPLVTLLKGDTIWGHVAWGIANHEGDAAVQEFLDSCRGAESSFAVSSGFPAGYICRPLPKPQPRDAQLSPEKYAEIKVSKKKRYLPASDYLDVSSPAVEYDRNRPFEMMVITHNSINRFSNTVSEGGLYAGTEQWAECRNFDLYIVTSYTAERVECLLTWAFENGYGADSTTGKGNIAVCGKPEEVKPKYTGTVYMALAPFVLPRQSDSITHLRADTFVRNGKIGGAFVSALTPWKKTVVMYDEGAVFSSNKPLQSVGMLLSDVHMDARICQSGFAPVIPIPEEA